MRPHLAPRRVLCVVLVTRSACSKGDGMALAATSPLMCAMSASRYAFTSSHTWGRGSQGLAPSPRCARTRAARAPVPVAPRRLPAPSSCERSR